MSIDSCFEVPESVRTSFIRENVGGYITEEQLETSIKRAEAIVNAYAGRDMDALSVLAYAAERGRFDEFAQKLDEHYQESLQFVHPEARRLAQIPGAIRAEQFFLECYQDLGIQQQKG